MTTPTQVRRPWKATVRTAFAVVVALAAMLPLLVAASGLDETLPPVAGALAIAGAITRIMALPAVDDFLARFVPWLAADPPSKAPLGFLGANTAPAGLRNMRRFQLHRDVDVSGVSGTGVVADGLVFPDGITVVRWRGERQSTVVWHSLDDVEAIHGHGGATRIVWTE